MTEQATQSSVRHGGSSGPSTGPLGEGFAGNLLHVGTQATLRLRASTQDAADTQIAMQRAQKEHLGELITTHDNLGAVIDDAAPPAYKSFPLDSPAITVNLIVGLILGSLTLFGVNLSVEKVNALTFVVAGLFVIMPLIAGFIIKKINETRRI